jgi:hypothetical protein
VALFATAMRDVDYRLEVCFRAKYGDIFLRRYSVKGIQFFVDDTGGTKAVLIDLKKYGDLWEDLYDAIPAHERKDAPRESFETIQKRLCEKGKLNRNG